MTGLIARYYEQWGTLAGQWGALAAGVILIVSTVNAITSNLAAFFEAMRTSELRLWGLLKLSA